MYNQFDETLRKQLKRANLKEAELAKAVRYDATYINKWLNGKKLPSTRNVDRIMEQIAELISAKTGIAADFFFDELKEAYDYDHSHLHIQAHSDLQLSVVTDITTLYQLTLDTIRQAMGQKEDAIAIQTNFDLLQLFDAEFTYWLKDIKALGVQKINFKMAFDHTALEESALQYATGILKMLAEIDDTDVTVVDYQPEAPKIMIINDFLAVQILWDYKNELAAVFSTDKKVISKFQYIANQFANKPQKLLDPAGPMDLRNTSVQITFYSDGRMWLFNHEPPALLFPDDVMDSLINQTEDEVYADYLKRLKAIFSKWTRYSEIDLVLFASKINQYTSDGKVRIGNVPQALTEMQVQSHLRYLSEIMKENPKFRVWLIRDTILSDEDLLYRSSFFIDTQALYIETSQKGATENFHISMNKQLKNCFQRYFENILREPYCQMLSPEDLLKFI